MTRPLVLLLQLPVPPLGSQAVRGNVPLAAAFLELYARRHGLEEHFRIEILPPESADVLGDCGLLEAILERQPWLVGFTCYLWNVERTLWIAGRLKQRQPQLKVVLGGPEITADDMPILLRLGRSGDAQPQRPSIDYAIFGEGERCFADLLAAARDHRHNAVDLPGLWRPGRPPAEIAPLLPELDQISSPYVEEILSPGPERLMFLETVARLRLPLQVLLLSEELRPHPRALARADRREPRLGQPPQRRRDLPPGPHAQRAARLHRFPRTLGRRQPRWPLLLLRRAAPREHRRRPGRAVGQGQLQRGRDRPASRSTPAPTS